jgi:hypothetical protein
MRHTHTDMPLHRIEYWTGEFFRAASLWEVGNYILIPHYSSGGSLCNELSFQKHNLETYQREKDDVDQCMPLNAASSAASTAFRTEWVGFDECADEVNDEERRHPDNSEEEEIEEVDDNFDDDLRPSAGYLDPTLPQHATRSAADDAPPGRDSLNNAYVRVIHLNGVHHLALVTCTCLDADAVHANLLSCRLIPTTFTRYRTLFTAGVLDDFRISNLECKVSAYQYYHKLRRLTNPAAPSNVPYFYRELLRLSRLWRWMKKLKWAGYGHKTADPNSPNSGELANFCPACPQPGINLPLNWKDDPNRYAQSNVKDRLTHIS